MSMYPDRVVTLMLLAWLCVAVASAGLFRNVSAPAVAATVWILTAIALLGCWKITAIKAWALAVNVQWLVLFHLTRLIVGVSFLIFCGRNWNVGGEGFEPPTLSV